MWATSLLRLGTQKTLTLEDLQDLPDEDKAAAAVAAYDRYRKHTHIKHLGLQILWFELKPFAVQFFWSLLSNVLAVLSPFLIYKITAFIESEVNTRDSVTSAWEPIVYAALLGLASVTRACADGQAFHASTGMGIRVRSFLVTSIYRKGLRHRKTGTTSTPDKPSSSARDIAEAPELQDVIVEKENQDVNAKPDDNNMKNQESLEQDKNASIGKIVTLMSSDAEKIQQACTSLVYILTSPLHIIGALAGLVFLLGWPAFVGVIIMILTVPVTYQISNVLNSVLEKLMEATDRRTTIINEVLQGIRIIKFFAWERNFQERIKDARLKEMSSLLKYYLTMSFSYVVWDGAPLLISFGTFFVYTYVAGFQLDAKTAFVAISLFGSLRVPLLAFPERIIDMIQVNVSVLRVQKFLEGEELEKYKNDKLANPQSSSIVSFKDGSFSWDFAENVETSEAILDETTPLLSQSSSSEAKSPKNQVRKSTFTLRNISFEVPEGGLTCICGATGSGKSSIIQALLGEMRKLSGSASLPTTEGFFGSGVAYVAQASWLMNATIRDNICFGEVFDPIRYGRVIRACALARDFETFDSGDLTEIGEKGINLSGGQKQRVSLARAAYSRSNCFLLDDPLSAVDAPTARHLFEQVICGLMSDRTRLLVTHAVNLTLLKADFVILVRKGEIFSCGDVASVLSTPEVESIISAEATVQILKDIRSPAAAGRTAPEVETRVLDYGNGKGRELAAKLVENEVSQSGAVKISVYWQYLGACGGALWLLAYALALVVERGAQAMESFWVRIWVQAYKEHDANTTMIDLGVTAACDPKAYTVANFASFLMPLPSSILNVVPTFCKGPPVDAMDLKPVNTLYYLGVYSTFIVFWVICSQSMFAIRVFGSYSASLKLHDQLIDRIMAAPIRFFDKTPIGRILNRASKDISSIDREVIGTFHDLLTIIAIVSYIVPAFILSFLPFGFTYFDIANQYLMSFRELKRIDSVTRSPIYSMFSETLSGASTIRAFGAERRFEDEAMRRLDVNNRAFFYMFAANRWLGVRVSTIAGIMIFSSAILTVLSRNLIGAELAAIALIWILECTDFMIWLIRIHGQLEMSMNSVERVGEYLTIEQERPGVIEDMRPPKNWPNSGAISIRDLELSYSTESEPVLKKINVEIPGGSKVGVVGRTGAGKTSLALALFQIVPTRGCIIIDGINISEIGLYDLRSRLTIIPQDPVLFAGTIRSNMDPFGEYTDAKIWSSLERVHIFETVQDHEISHKSHTLEQVVPGAVTQSAALDLDTAVADGGANFSLGQRQLLCLARALLKSSKVLVLDEATASVDHETDSRIQRTIRGPEFESVTVISIAHRLRTIAD
ncbi:hypothetical protein HDU97_007368 [Phlyctochytrium planicorne]|nr:hypothetical protein HDU97_007368 [Phlyctochytrium planicorne]